MILIGSRAIKLQDPSFLRGDKSDWDYVLDDELTASLAKGRGRDVHHSKEVYWALHPYCKKSEVGLIPSLPALYTLKVSHAFWNVHWGKTMSDIVWFQEKGVEFLPELYEKLYAYWETRHGKKRAYLNMPNEKFFTKAVNRKYVHDDIHSVMAYYDEPMYKKLKKDMSKALISKSMFEALAPEDKDKTVREEAYVTALERFIIPSDFTSKPEMSYKRALNLLVTSMSKSWFPLYIVLNYARLKELDQDYVKRFREGESACQLVI